MILLYCYTFLLYIRDMNYSTYSLTFPRDILGKEKGHPLLRPLLPLETGLFEKAAGHGIFRRDLGEYILIYCVEGKGFLELGGGVHRVEPGMAFVCPPGLSHRYWADPADPWTIYWVHFTGDCVPYILAETGHTAETPCLSLGVRGRMKSSFIALAECFRRGHGFPHIYGAAAALYQLFSAIITIKSYRMPFREEFPDMEELLDYLWENLDKNLTLDDLAAKAGISKFHLSRRFTGAAGIPPMAYFLQLKIRRACEILDTTDLKVREIGESLGFNTANYFSESFKRITGTTPSLYRQSRRAGI